MRMRIYRFYQVPTARCHNICQRLIFMLCGGQGEKTNDALTSKVLSIGMLYAV